MTNKTLKVKPKVYSAKYKGATLAFLAQVSPQDIDKTPVCKYRITQGSGSRTVSITTLVLIHTSSNPLHRGHKPLDYLCTARESRRDFTLKKKQDTYL